MLVTEIDECNREKKPESASERSERQTVRREPNGLDSHDSFAKRETQSVSV